jgi:hypothetical protein
MIRPIEIITEDRGWKGTCGRIGERWIIHAEQLPKPYGPGQHSAFGFEHISHHNSTFKTVPWRPSDVRWIARVMLKRWWPLPCAADFLARPKGMRL